MAGRFFTSCRVSSQEIPPLPTTIPARSTVTGTPPVAEQALDLAARPQVGGEVGALGAETAEVDDLAYAGRGRRLAERPGGAGVHALEVGAVEGVHEVVGDVDALEGRGEGVGVVDVRPDRGAGTVVRLGAAGQRPDVVTLLDEGAARAGDR